MEQFFEFVANHYLMWGSLVLILVLIIREEMNGSEGSTSVSPANAVKLINHQNALVIDLRDKEAYSQGHIINAMSKTAESLAKQKDYQKKTLVLVCENGQQSQSTLGRLKQQGFESIFSLQGGMKAWLDAELPTAQ